MSLLLWGHTFPQRFPVQTELSVREDRGYQQQINVTSRQQEQKCVENECHSPCHVTTTQWDTDGKCVHVVTRTSQDGDKVQLKRLINFIGMRDLHMQTKCLKLGLCYMKHCALW